MIGAPMREREERRRISGNQTSTPLGDIICGGITPNDREKLIMQS